MWLYKESSDLTLKFGKRVREGWVVTLQASGPGCTISYMWLSATFAQAHCSELHLVGTGGLCVVCPPE